MKVLKPKKLKILPQYFEEVVKGNKKAEWRKNDRDYKVDDEYTLCEIDEKGKETGRTIDIVITHIVYGGKFDMPSDYCMFSFRVVGGAESVQEANKPPQDAKYGELLRLVAENPSLPVVPMVYSEVWNDNYSYWLGEFGYAVVNEYVCVSVGKYGDSRFYTKDYQEEIEEQFADEILNETDITEEEAVRIAHEKAENLPWKKAIIVYIDLPE